MRRRSGCEMEECRGTREKRDCASVPITCLVLLIQSCKYLLSSLLERQDQEVRDARDARKLAVNSSSFSLLTTHAFQ